MLEFEESFKIFKKLNMEDEFNKIITIQKLKQEKY
jgi:hypothetical protein